jgi:hypothetical protein
MNNDKTLQTFVDLLKKDITLDDSTRHKYINTIEKLARGERIEYEDSSALLTYIEDVFDEAENNALRTNDAAAINELAELRAEKDYIYSTIMDRAINGYPDSTAAKPDTTHNKDPKINDLLNRLSPADNTV